MGRKTKANINHPGLKVLDHWLKYQSLQGDVPGFQVSIRSDGELIYSRAFGYSNLARKSKYSVSHLGCIASQSKVITMAVVYRLASDGRLDLNKKIVHYLPELKKHKDPRFNHVKVLDLLTHRAGVVRDSLNHNYWGDKKSFPSDKDLLHEIRQHRLVYKSGKHTKYSNLGYALLGIIVKKISNSSVEELAQALLNLNIGTSKSLNRSKPIANGYLKRQNQKQTFRRVPLLKTRSLGPAAGFYANTDLMTEFFHDLYLTDKFFDQSKRKSLITRKWMVKNIPTEFYGIGTMFSSVGELTMLGHSGGFPGFSSQTWVLPASKLSIGFITNVSTIKTFLVIQTIVEVLASIQKHFSNNELSSLIVSEPIMDNFSSTIYVVGKKKALAFPITGWHSSDDISVFKRRGKVFIAENISGFKNVGEPLLFTISNNKIKRIQFGGFHGRPIRRD